MMKKVLVCAGFLLASNVVFAQTPVVGVVNLEQALFNTQAAQELQAAIEIEFREDQQRAEALNSELRALIERAQRDESIMSDAEKRRVSTDAQEKQVQLQMIAERVQAALQERNQAFIDSMRQNLGTAIETVVREGGYNIVLNADSVAFFDNAYDITGKVTAKLNELNR
ncbi:MAG: OmpH family outer membrane protein [Gammaproteobacteria bacterium]|nr:OmpH family outer membrane protein [Gammaproteobacteria bacterium]MDP2140958.1 OmpH family outer membrane protein [Gammaproteobacteria bacterium]MDP2349298.1 OmpH family outer membrane protein [Gammaproteobacteria bacterium]